MREQQGSWWDLFFVYGQEGSRVATRVDSRVATCVHMCAPYLHICEGPPRQGILNIIEYTSLPVRRSI